MTDIKLLGISGSLRKGSLNTKLVRAAAQQFGPCDFTMADIRMPLYDGDLEESNGIPAEVTTLAQQISAASAIVMATPEYNANLSGVLKNALDWLSRTDGNLWAGKPVAIVSAAAGRTGGARAQFSLRHCMTPFNPVILQGPEVMIAGAMNEFDENDQLLGEMGQDALNKLMSQLHASIQS